MLPTENIKLSPVLAFLRLALGTYLICEALQYFADPIGALKLWNQLYPIQMMGNWVPLIGVASMILSLLFIVGAFKPVSYGVVVLVQFATVLASFLSIYKYNGLENIDRLSFLYHAAGIPLLASFFILFLLRDYDNWTMDVWVHKLHF